METLQEYLVDYPKAIVLVVHGSGEHIGRYKHVGEWLNKKEVSMIGGDLPGLGKSTEERGHIDTFKDYLQKVEEWHNFIIDKYKNIPIFIMGHSLGGLIVLRYLQELKNRETIMGAIVSSPAVSIGVEVPTWQISMANLLVKIWPTFKLSSGIKADQVSRDPVVVQSYGEDPLVYSKVSIKWFFEFQKAIQEAWNNTNRLKNLDILYLQAGADQLVKPEMAGEFVRRVNSSKITFELIPDLYHEIFNEPEKEIYLEKMTDWIINRIG